MFVFSYEGEILTQVSFSGLYQGYLDMIRRQLGYAMGIDPYDIEIDIEF